MSKIVPVMKNLFTENQEGNNILLANKCKFCGQVFFPRGLFCFNCYARDMEELELSRKGTLYSYTIGRMPSLNFDPPYAVGYIDMPEGVRIFSPLEMTGREFVVGMTMEVVIKKLWREGEKEVVGYTFKPV